MAMEQQSAGVDDAPIDFERLGAMLMHSSIDEDNGYHCCDSVYTHPVTGAKLYIGNINAARESTILQERNITRIVNCQDNHSANYHEDNPSYAYLRFPISRWEGHVLVKSAAMCTTSIDSRVMAYMQPLFSFCDEALEDGRSVLVHCRAGAHRAGTAGTAYLMWGLKVSCSKALALAKAARPVVDPFCHLLQLLQLVSKALGHDEGESVSIDEAAREKYRKMLKIGIPWPSVEQKMRAHGHTSMIASLMPIKAPEEILYKQEEVVIAEAT